MKVSFLAFVATAVATIALSNSAAAECPYPRTPSAVPNGNTATEAEMLEGMKVFKKYDADINAYLTCLDLETTTNVTAAGDQEEQIKQIKAMSVKRHNAAVAELEARAEEFNVQLKAYKAKHKG